jgi:hypothetical protein
LTDEASNLFRSSGNYDSRAINLWLYEHTNAQYMLYPFTHVTTCGQSKAAILSAAPRACKAIFIQYEHNAGNGTSIQHYKTWMQGPSEPAARHNPEDVEWYECESIAYADYRMVKRLTENDWLSFTGHMMCLVAADAYATCQSILTPLDTSEMTGFEHRMRTGQVHAAAGQDVHISPTPTTCMIDRHRQCQADQAALQTALQLNATDPMHVDQPPPRHQPNVYWSNPLAQIEAMEISSDEE